MVSYVNSCVTKVILVRICPKLNLPEAHIEHNRFYKKQIISQRNWQRPLCLIN
jgi:hypothetical protein